jgi:outer membrane murein-binding lipoprotein Lpp
LKKLVFVFAVMFLLAGCSENIDYASLQKHMDTMKASSQDFATGGGDIEQFAADVEAFNAELKKIKSDDENVMKYVEYQLKANELRLEGLKNEDYDKITESSMLQYSALSLLDEINK